MQNPKLREAYKVGFQDGLCEAEKRLTCAVKTNAELWQEVLRLDDDHPVAGTGVLLPRQFAENILQALDETGPHPKYYQLLGQYVERANRSTRELAEKLETFAAH